MNGTTRKCILLADDSKAVRQLLKFILGMHMTLDIYEAGDGLDAVNKPIIVVSTQGNEADKDEGLKLGANSYVTKPIQAPDLLREVTNLLN